jgi:hypothetical protein
MRFSGHFRQNFFHEALKANGRAAIRHSPVSIFVTFSRKTSWHNQRQPEDREVLQLKQG